MNVDSLIDLVPELLIGFGMLGGVAWFRKQDQEQLKSMRAEVRQVRLAALPGPDDDIEVTATGNHRAVVVPWERLSTQLDELGEKVDDEIAESRKFRDATLQRVTVLETDYRWLRRGAKSHADTRDDRKG